MSRPDSITAQVRLMSPPRFTVTEAARMVGRSPDTLRRWRRAGVATASHTRAFGLVTVHLYDEDDIEALKTYAKTQRPGRKKNDANP